MLKNTREKEIQEIIDLIESIENDRFIHSLNVMVKTCLKIEKER